MERVYSYQNQGAILYIVATPIGNLKEFTPRAIEVINASNYIACEDTRNTSKLLHEFSLNKPCISCHEHNEEEASKKIIELLKKGNTISFMSDAGYPGISDPGERLIKNAIKNHIPVSVVNGSSAFLPALIGSGLDTEHFYFHGFLPAKESERKKTLLTLKNYEMTLIFYEAPHRIEHTLKDMFQIFSLRRVVIAREISKLYEEYIRGTLDELIKLDFSLLKGEMVIIVEGEKQKKVSISDEELIKIIKTRLKGNVSFKDLSTELAIVYDLKKNAVYDLILKVKKDL